MSLAQEIMAGLDRLPPFPEVARRVMRLARDPSAGAQEIYKVVRYDQAVTANCLKLINSSYFGMRQRVSSLRQAVALLGTENLVKLVLTGGGVSLLAGSHEGYGLMDGALWRHSVTSAIVSQLILKRLGRAQDPMLYTAALLHDVGKVALDRFVHSEFEEIITLVGEAGMSFIEAEEQVLGLGHAEVGGEIARAWRFPEPLADAIRYHHSRKNGDYDNTDSLLPWVRLSNLISNMIGVGTGYDGMACRMDKGLLKFFDLARRDIQQIMAEYVMEMRKAEDLLEISGKQ